MRVSFDQHNSPSYRAERRGTRLRAEGRWRDLVVRLRPSLLHALRRWRWVLPLSASQFAPPPPPPPANVDIDVDMDVDIVDDMEDL